MKELILKFGDIPILIPDINPNYLLFKGKSDGLNLIPTKYFKNEKVEIFIEENNTGSISDIDSALIIKDLNTNHVLLNLNDCIYNEQHVNKLKNIINSIGGNIDLLALAYTGAGPYPQTYIDPEENKELLISEAYKKKLNFFEKYKKYCKSFESTYHLPFAGEYILGGKLHYLNEYRGVADPLELKEFDNRAIILANGGIIDFTNGEISNERNKPYLKEDIEERLELIKNNSFDYEDEIKIPFEKINFMRLLKQASKKASEKSELIDNYNFVFSIKDETGKIRLKLDLNTADNSLNQIDLKSKINHKMFSEIKIDYRYLYGLLTAVYHWNNAEVGSLYFTSRHPLKNYNPKVQDYLNFLAVA